MYSIHYVIKFVSDLRQVRWFSPGTPVFSTNKTDRHDITEILLKVALNTIILTQNYLTISGVMVSVVASSAVDRGFKPRSSQAKHYKLVFYFFSAKHPALRRKQTGWLGIRIMCAERSNVSTCCCFSEVYNSN